MCDPSYRKCLYSAFCLVAIGAFCLPRNVHASSSERRKLIQGEAIVNEDVTTIAVEDRWPYTVAVAVCKDSIPTSIICGGTLIHPDVVLTAAHCLKAKNDSPLPPASAVCILHGTANMTQALLDPQNITVLSAKDYAINPNYKQINDMNEFHMTGDVALLFLNESILQPARPEAWVAAHTSNPGYALLPNPDQKWDRFNFAFFGVTIGWGLTENATRTYGQPGDPEPQRLDKERITFQVAMSPQECREAPLFFGTKNQQNDTFCGAWFGGFEKLFGGDGDGIVSTICRGDSGGGFVIPSTTIDPFGFQGDVQIGIVSAGPPCPYTPLNDTLVWPAEYVDVSQYVRWIHSEMKQRGLTPLHVATSPLKRAFNNQTCYPGNCYEEDVMEGVVSSDGSTATGGSAEKTSSGAVTMDTIPASLIGVVVAAVAVLF